MFSIFFVNKLWQKYYAFHFLQVYKQIFLTHFLQLHKNTHKNQQKCCHSFVARSLANCFLRTIPQKVHNFLGYGTWKVLTFYVPYPGKWSLMYSMVWYAESESKFANISRKLQKNSKIFFWVKLGSEGPSIHEKSRVWKSHAAVPFNCFYCNFASTFYK